MQFLFALFFLGTFSLALSQSCTDPTELETCVYKSAFMMNPDIKLPSSVAEMKDHCSNGQDSLNCMLKFNEKCVMGPPQVSLKRIYSTVQNGLKERCTNDAKLKEFIEQLKCLRDDNNKMEMVRTCSDKHIKHLEILIDVPEVERPSGYCCAFRYFHDCVKDVVVQQCGNEVADYFENLLNEFKDEMMMTICEKYSTVEKCAANLPGSIWNPMKAIIDRTDKIEHNYKTTIPIMFRLLDKFLKKN